MSLTLLQLAVQGARHYARSHAGTLIGATLASAILTGALIVGDSVRYSLRWMAEARLGKVELAMPTGDRLVRTELAKPIEEMTDGSTVAVLWLPATAAVADGSSRANRVQLYGVNDRFWALAPGVVPAEVQALAEDEVALGEPLARQLRVKVGDTVVVRASKPSKLSQDAPLAPDENTHVALRLKVKGVLGAEAFGRFSLQASQLPALNAFVSLGLLQKRVEEPGKANLLLVGEGGAARPEVAQAAFDRSWTLTDAQLELRVAPEESQELRTSRVFIDPPVEAAAAALAPTATRILTYFVNDLRVGDRSTPYSMVSAVSSPLAPADLGEDEMLLNPWLAEDLQAKPGDLVRTKYYVVGLGRALEEREATFKVKGILATNHPALHPSLMPDFPGMSGASNCRDWDTGFPIDTDRIREKDEAYWDQYKGTPKAVISLAAGQRLWSNRFGNLTAIRFGAGDPAQLASNLLARLPASSIGLRFDPMQAMAAASVSQSQDFGGLFIGFSFFLIVAALVLGSLLFQFALEQRSAEIGLLKALGFTPGKVRRLLVVEGGVIALAGSLLGLAGAVAYGHLMVRGLATVWQGAVGTETLLFHASPVTLVGGCLGSAVLAVATVWFGLKRLSLRPARELLAAGQEESAGMPTGKANRPAVVAIGALAGAVLLSGGAFMQSGSPNPGLFFGAGALLLIGGLALVSWRMRSWVARGTGLDAGGSPRALVMNLGAIALRNNSRRPRRSLSAIGLLASGCFLVVSIGVFRLDEVRDAAERSSGTGGFSLIGESGLKVVHDLNTAEGREKLGLDAAQMEGVSLVSFRVREGEDASCLNLNRAQRPRLVGVRASELARRGSFRFVSLPAGVTNGWQALDQEAGADVVPAIGDQASILWALGKKVGDTLPFTDERGRTFQVKLVGAVANSILQGNLVISEKAFLERFPGESGYRMFLIDAPSNRVDAVAKALGRGLQDLGLEVTRATERLAAFNAVQNTYLGTFQALGGLGLVLGSAGLGALLLRNVLERRGELATLRAIGFPRRRVLTLVLWEHAGLLGVGLGLGTAAGALAVIPALVSTGTPIPVVSLALTLAGVVLSGLICTIVAAMFAVRGPLLGGLRAE